MIQINEIPLVNQSQKFSTQINGITYKMVLIWRDPFGYFLDIYDANGSPLCCGISMSTGANLLTQYTYLFNYALVVLSDKQINTVPTYANLGIDTHLCVVQNV